MCICVSVCEGAKHIISVKFLWQARAPYRRAVGTSAGAVCGWQINRAAVELSVPPVELEDGLHGNARANGTAKFNLKLKSNSQSQSVTPLGVLCIAGNWELATGTGNWQLLKANPRAQSHRVRDRVKSRPSLSHFLSLCLSVAPCDFGIQRRKKGANFMSASFNK